MTRRIPIPWIPVLILGFATTNFLLGNYFFSTVLLVGCLGSVLNRLVVFANHNRMPVIIKDENLRGRLKNHDDPKDVRLKILCDRFQRVSTSGEDIRVTSYSVGDVVIYLSCGLGVIAFTLQFI